MGRSLKKGPYIDPKLYGKVARMNDSGVKDPITTWARRWLNSASTEAPIPSISAKPFTVGVHDTPRAVVRP